MEPIQNLSPESKVMSLSLGKGAQSQHGVGVSNHEAGDLLSPGRMLVYFLLGPSEFLYIVSIIRRMVTAGMHYGQTNKNPKSLYSYK